MIWESLIDFVFPKTCVGCGAWKTFLCKDCRDKLDFADQICPICCEGSVMGWTHKQCQRKRGMDGLIAIYEYQEPVMRGLIDGIKYDFNKELVSLVLENFLFEMGENFDYLVPVPLHFYRENWRGFNQAEEIAKEFGKQMGKPVKNVLIRNKNTKQQALMKSKEERERNIRGVFEISRENLQGVSLKGKKVLLVDDVFTSGADMRECTRVLKKAGVKLVWGLVLAH